MFKEIKYLKHFKWAMNNNCLFNIENIQIL